MSQIVSVITILLYNHNILYNIISYRCFTFKRSNDNNDNLLLYALVPSFYMHIFNCLCGSVAKASDTQAVGHGFDPRPDH